MKKPLWVQKLEYQYEKQIDKGMVSRIIMLFVATLLVVVIATAIMFLQDAESNVTVNVWNNATTAINAWMPEIEEEEDAGIDWGYYVITALVAISGLFITSTLIGIISGGIEEKLEEVRKGKTLLFENGHIVLLGYGLGSSRILEEIAEHADGRNVIVVIADAVDRLELEETVKSSVDLPKNVKMIARNVDITDVAALQCCSIPTASTVIIRPEDDGKALKAVLAVSLILKEHPESSVHVVAGVYKRKRMLPQEALDPRIRMIRVWDTVACLMARCSVYPGLSKVLTDIFDFKGSELYLEKAPELAGKNFLEVMETMEGAVPIGLVRDGQKLLIPKPGVILREQDQLIHFAENAGGFSIAESKAEVEVELDPVRKHFGPAKKVVIFGMNTALGTILQELPENVHHVMIVSTQKEELEAAAAIAKEEKAAVELYEADRLEEEELLKLVVDAGHIILIASTHAPGGDPDADNLALLIKLRYLRETEGLEYSITVEFLDDNCRMMAEGDDDTDFVVASSMSSLILSQAALNPQAMEFIREFTRHEGKALTVKSCEAFGCTGKERSVRELRKIVYLQEHILLGYITNRNGRTETVINPSLEKTVELTEKDSLVVLGA